MKKFALIFFIVFLCSIAFSQSDTTANNYKIDVSKLFDNATATVDALYVHIPALQNKVQTISGQVFVDSNSLAKYLDRLNVPESERNSFLSSEDDFEIASGNAQRLKNSAGNLSDYFVWVNSIDFDKKQAVVYVMFRYADFGAQENSSESGVIKIVSLREFRKVSCSASGILKFGESFSCLLPGLDGNTITITLNSVNYGKKSVSVNAKWSHSFFKDVYWQNHWINVEYAVQGQGYAVRKDSADELIKFNDLMAEKKGQYVFSLSSGQDENSPEKSVSYIIYVSGLYSDEVRFTIGYINSDNKVSWLDLDKTKEFSSNRVPNEVIPIDCFPDELWVGELTFTKEDLNSGKNTKTCYVKGFSSKGTPEVIQVSVDSISNEGKTVSFKLKYLDVTSYFNKILKILGKEDSSMLDVFGSKKVVDLFLAYPDQFVEIAEAARLYSARAFIALSDKNVAGLFSANPDAFVEIAKVADLISDEAFYALKKDNEAQRFMDYTNKKISFDQFIVTILSSDSLAIEIGTPLDQWHIYPDIRQRYLNSLSTVKVVALLNSNPDYFYTSTNHMLFDRLKKDLGNKTITQMFEEYDLMDTVESRNFLFRAITYGRLYGKSDSMLVDSDVKAFLPSLLEPLNSDEFDKIYFFRLANAIDGIRGVPEVINQVKQITEKKLQQRVNDKNLEAALEYIDVLVDEQTSLVSENKKALMRQLDEKKIFNPDYYRNDGKIIVLQVFDKEDTGQDHWFMTQDWFTAYFGKKPLTGQDGELVYENANTKMILFMGETEKLNQEFIKNQLQLTPNLIMTFRGHSYSLLFSFPYWVFGNINSHILFIPGSCGSASSTPEYISVNHETDLRFVSNTSTGRGQVTNAIVEALLKSKKKSFQNLLLDSADSISKNGGDISSLQVMTKGELLMWYVLDQTKQ